MMKLNIKNIVPILLSSLLLWSVSCAEKVEDNYDEDEIASLKLWMGKNYPDYSELQPGLFAKVIKGANSKSEVKPTTIDDWLYINYTGRDLQGNYFANTYKKTSKHLGTFAYTTHFVPLIYRYGINGTAITKGVYEVLGTMNEGDSVDMFMASTWAFGQNGSGSSGPYRGYGGNLGINAQKPARFSMSFTKMTAKPLDLEVTDVVKYVQEQLKLEEKDSVEKGFYYKIIKAFPEADTIPLDSTIQLKYTGYFLDNFVFDTNVKEVAIANNIPKTVINEMDGTVDDTADPYAPLSFNYNSSSFVAGFKETVKKMRVGETAIAVFTSKFGYGMGGNTGGKTIVQPYESLVFEIKVLSPDESK